MFALIWNKNVNNGFCNHLLQLRGLKSSRLINLKWIYPKVWCTTLLVQYISTANGQWCVPVFRLQGVWPLYLKFLLKLHAPLWWVAPSTDNFHCIFSLVSGIQRNFKFWHWQFYLKMEIICSLLDEGQRTKDNRSISETIKTVTNHFLELSNVSATPPSRSTQNITLLTSHLDPWDFHDWNKNMVVPFLCTIGIIGNVLNIAVLGRRIHEGRSRLFSFVITIDFFLIELHGICRILFLVLSGKQYCWQ